MKNKLKAGLAAGLALLGGSAQAANMLYKYDILITDSRFAEFDQAGAMTAGFVLDIGHGADCVDLREALRMLRQDHGAFLLQREIITLLSRLPIPPAQFDGLQARFCPPGALPGCAARLEGSSAFEVSDLSIVAESLEGPGGRAVESIHRLSDVPMPTFSVACRTGRLEDSWNGTASTPAARELLSSLGIVLARVNALALRDERNHARVWTLGFPAP
jgi:hypothetical protein